MKCNVQHPTLRCVKCELVRGHKGSHGADNPEPYSVFPGDGGSVVNWLGWAKGRGRRNRETWNTLMYEN